MVNSNAYKCWKLCRDQQKSDKSINHLSNKKLDKFHNAKIVFDFKSTTASQSFLLDLRTKILALVCVLSFYFLLFLWIHKNIASSMWKRLYLRNRVT